MKRIAIIICLALITLSAKGQSEFFHPDRMNDREIIQMQTRDIAEWLDLRGKTLEKFEKEYASFRKEIDAVARKAAPPRRFAKESDIDKAIRRNFEVSEKILQIRKKYYSRFKEFLKPSQILMIYNWENEAGRRMHEGPGEPHPHEPAPRAPEMRN